MMGASNSKKRVVAWGLASSIVMVLGGCDSLGRPSTEEVTDVAWSDDGTALAWGLCETKLVSTSLNFGGASADDIPEERRLRGELRIMDAEGTNEALLRVYPEGLCPERIFFMRSAGYVLVEVATEDGAGFTEIVQLDGQRTPIDNPADPFDAIPSPDGSTIALTFFTVGHNSAPESVVIFHDPSTGVPSDPISLEWDIHFSARHFYWHDFETFAIRTRSPESLPEGEPGAFLINATTHLVEARANLEEICMPPTTSSQVAADGQRIGAGTPDEPVLFLDEPGCPWEPQDID